MQRWTPPNFLFISFLIVISFAKGIFGLDYHFETLDSTNVTLSIMDGKELNLRFVEGRTLVVRSGSHIWLQLKSIFRLELVSPLWDRQHRPSYFEDIYPQEVADPSTWTYELAYGSDLIRGQDFFGFIVIGNVSKGHFMYIIVDDGEHWTIPCGINSPHPIPKLIRITHVQHENGEFSEVTRPVKAKYNGRRGFTLKNDGPSKELPAIFDCRVEDNIVPPYRLPPPRGIKENEVAVRESNLTIAQDEKGKLYCSSSEEGTLQATFLNCNSRNFCRLLEPCFVERCSSNFFAAPGASCDSCSELPLDTPSTSAFVGCQFSSGAITKQMIIKGMDGKTHVTPIDESPADMMSLRIQEVPCKSPQTHDRCYECQLLPHGHFRNISWTVTFKSGFEQRVPYTEIIGDPPRYSSIVGIIVDENMLKISCTGFSDSDKTSVSKSMVIKELRVEKPRARKKKPWSKSAVGLLYVVLALGVIIILFSLCYCVFKSFEDSWLPPHDQWPNPFYLCGIAFLMLLVLVLGFLLIWYLYQASCACVLRILKIFP